MGGAEVWCGKAENNLARGTQALATNPMAVQHGCVLAIDFKLKIPYLSAGGGRTLGCQIRHMSLYPHNLLRSSPAG